MTSYAPLQAQLVEAAKQMAERGLVIGSEGNVSVRIPEEDRFLITPSSLPYTELAPEDTVQLGLSVTVEPQRDVDLSDRLERHDRLQKDDQLPGAVRGHEKVRTREAKQDADFRLGEQRRVDEDAAILVKKR